MNERVNRYKLPEPVYYVQSETDDTVLVGMDVEQTGTWMSWFDTTKERRMKVESVMDSSPQHFVFKRSTKEGGHTYRFVPMSLDIYKAQRAKLLNSKDFDDEASMIKAFLETAENSW